MDKLRKLFHRKSRKEDTSSTARPSTPPRSAKRNRGDEESNASPATLETSPSKRARQTSGDFRLPALKLHEQQSRIDSHSGSNESEPRSSTTQANVPAIDYSPAKTDFSSMFASLSVDNLNGPAPQARTQQARPFSTLDRPRGDSMSGKRTSLPPQALFSRGLKRWTEGGSEDAIGDGASQTERPSSERRDPWKSAAKASTLTLDDILNRPLFEEPSITDDTAAEAPAATSSNAHTNGAPTQSSSEIPSPAPKTKAPEAKASERETKALETKPQAPVRNLLGVQIPSAETSSAHAALVRAATSTSSLEKTNTPGA